MVSLWKEVDWHKHTMEKASSHRGFSSSQLQISHITAGKGLKTLEFCWGHLLPSNRREFSSSMATEIRAGCCGPLCVTLGWQKMWFSSSSLGLAVHRSAFPPAGPDPHHKTSSCSFLGWFVDSPHGPAPAKHILMLFFSIRLSMFLKKDLSHDLKQPPKPQWFCATTPTNSKPNWKEQQQNNINGHLVSSLTCWVTLLLNSSLIWCLGSSIGF